MFLEIVENKIYFYAWILQFVGKNNQRWKLNMWFTHILLEAAQFDKV